jgi:hypothetical protein
MTVPVFDDCTRFVLYSSIYVGGIRSIGESAVDAARSVHFVPSGALVLGQHHGCRRHRPKAALAFDASHPTYHLTKNEGLSRHFHVGSTCKIRTFAGPTTSSTDGQQALRTQELHLMVTVLRYACMLREEAPPRPIVSLLVATPRHRSGRGTGSASTPTAVALCMMLVERQSVASSVSATVVLGRAPRAPQPADGRSPARVCCRTRAHTGGSPCPCSFHKAPSGLHT